MINKIKTKILNEIDKLAQNLHQNSNYDICIALRDLYLWIREQEGENIKTKEYLEFLDKYKKGAKQ